MRKRQPKILIVDDTEPTRYAMARILKREGYLTVEAETGVQALTMIKSERPDLITLDIHLPDMLGFEVCRRVRSNPATAEIPILQVSASYVSAGDRVHGLDGGADCYLTHPFDPSVLIATVGALLRARGQSDDLRQAEERFRVALKYAPIMIYTTDADLRYTWLYNPPAGLSADSFIGKDDRQILSNFEADLLIAHKLQVMSTGVGKRVMVTMTFSNRTYIFDVTIEPLLTADPSTSGLTVACIDVTDRLRAEESQRLAFLDAEVANQAKSRFLANMSHEIRTPLGVIQGYTDLALEDVASASDRREYLLTIKRNARDLTTLLGDILDLAKIEAGRIEVERLQFSLPKLLREVINGLKVNGRSRQLDLSLTFDGAVPKYVQTDRGLLRQILVNLISNALKFTEAGEVRVRVRTLESASPGGLIRIGIRVEDTGIGLTDEQSQRLFEPFMQADSSTTRKFGGTGLGLSLSKKLANALEGDLTLVSTEPGGGSVFEVTFDAGVAEVGTLADADMDTGLSAPNESPTSPAGSLAGMRILLVEDSEDNQVLFMHYLRTMGASVELAVDGVDGLAKARKGAFDAILMDIQMPNLDGHGATKALRGDGNSVPIIALTAHALKEERDRALKLGFDCYLTKPVSQRGLIDALKPYRREIKLAISSS